MTNEELIEEIYWTAHNSGVFKEFQEYVNGKLKLSSKRNPSEVVEECYYHFIECGKIDSSLQQID